MKTKEYIYTPKCLIYFLCTVLLSSCGYGLAYEEHITGIYYLTAADSEEDISLSCLQGKGFYCDIISSTVYAVGHNNDFIIAKQHPHQFAEPIDKSVTNYYIIPLKNKVSEFPYDNKIGPLTLEQFNKKRKELNMPKGLIFTIVFEDLK
jgi:hypothetical protein